MNRHAAFLMLMCVICGCFKPNSPSYKALYAHLNNPPIYPKAKWESDCFLVIYVNARHLDYTDNYSFLNTIAKHPDDGSRTRDVGHAWIYLQGFLNGELVYIYGGHSGERGLCQARYFDGIMNYMDFGYANPSAMQLDYPAYEPNPVKYLWEVQRDGFFEYGAGMHKPTYAVKLNLTSQQFDAILEFIRTYDYSNYSLIGLQCASFASHIAALAGLDLDCKMTIAINKELYLKGERIRFWEDPYYAQLTISSPDILERSLMQAVAEGKAEYVDCRNSQVKKRS